MVDGGRDVLATETKQALCRANNVQPGIHTHKSRAYPALVLGHFSRFRGLVLILNNTREGKGVEVVVPMGHTDGDTSVGRGCWSGGCAACSAQGWRGDIAGSSRLDTTLGVRRAGI
jgi:hypothetical protein